MIQFREHAPIFALLLAVVFAAFGRIMATPLWDLTDAAILCDAHVLSHDPSPMFAHVGFYFSQPLLQLSFLVQYRIFGLEPAGYVAVNLFIHTANAFVVYMLVNLLFPRKRMAVLAALLFALGVGSYGRVFTSIHQLEALLLAMLHLLVLYVFIRNDFRRGGRVLSPLFALGLALFLMAGLTKAASFSLVGALVAYKVFFHRRHGRRILSPDIIIILVVAGLFTIAQGKWGFRGTTVFDEPAALTRFSLLSFKNIFRYLNLMFFPMQGSSLLDQAPFWVEWVFDARRVIRTALSLAIISYSFFGIVFGSRSIRFFIAWTYVSLLPFTALSAAGGWLNLSHLYLTSLGFCVILAAGTIGTSDLLARRRWRRYVPYIVPLYFVLISLFMTNYLDHRHRNLADHPLRVAMRAELLNSCRDNDLPHP